MVALGLTKAGKRVGAAESVVSAPKRRSLFNQSLAALKITSLGFRPYSLRRGGVTWWYNKHHSFDRLLTNGRWQAAKTARIYLNDGLAMLAEIRIPQSDPHVSPFLAVFDAKFTKPTFTTLEPLFRNRKLGGCGIGPNQKILEQKRGSSEELGSCLSWGLAYSMR